MGHAYSCPHDCGACKEIVGRWFIGAWKRGGCVICGSDSRDGKKWAHEECFMNLSHSEENDMRTAIYKHKFNSLINE